MTRSLQSTAAQFKIAMLIAGGVWLTYWIYLLSSPLGADEGGTIWVVSGTLQELLYRAYTIQGQSPLAYLPFWISCQIFGIGEFALRFPLLIALALSAWGVACLAKLTLPSPSAPYFAAALFLFLPQTLALAVSVRPYLFALTAAVWSSYALYFYITKGSRGAFWLLTATATLCIYLHYVAILHLFFLVLLSLYLCDNARSRYCTLSALGLGVLLALPCTFQLYSLWLRKVQLTFLFPPTYYELITAITPLFLLVLSGLFVVGYFAKAIPAECFSRPTPQNYERSNLGKFLILLLLWSTIYPVLLYTLNKLTGAPPFAGRYWTWQIIPISLFGAALLSSFTKLRVALPLFIALLILSVSSYEITRRESALPHSNFIKRMQQALQKVPHCVVLANPGLVESQQLAFLQQPELRSYLLSSLQWYLPNVRIEPLPINASTTELKEYLASLIKNIHSTPCIIVTNVTSFAQSQSAVEVVAQLLKSGYVLREQESYAYLDLSILERVGS